MITSSSKVSSRHWKLKEKATKLRAKGLSYNEILKKVPVAKSTISLWCRYVKLTPEQRKELHTKRVLKNAMKGIRAIQSMFWQRRCDAFATGVASCNSKKINANSRFVAGLMLYWAEGAKSRGKTSIANSDPRTIRFMVSWFKEFFDIEPTMLKIHLHLHSGQSEDKMKSFWSKLTRVPLQNFGKSFIKPEGSGYRKNILYNGTVRLGVKKVGSTYLMFKILGAINGFLSQTINEPVAPENWIPKLPYAAPSSIGRARSS